MPARNTTSPDWLPTQNLGYKGSKPPVQNVMLVYKLERGSGLISCGNEESAVPLSDTEQSESLPVDVDMESRPSGTCRATVEVVETGTRTTDGEHKYKMDEMERELHLFA